MISELCECLLETREIRSGPCRVGRAVSLAVGRAESCRNVEYVQSRVNTVNTASRHLNSLQK